MTLIRWQPFQEMETLRRQMDRVFDELASVNRDAPITWKPAIELQDTEDSLILRAQLPGIEAKDLDIRISREAVVITGERRYEKKEQEGGYVRSEFRYGNFQRVIPLPVAIQNDRVESEFKDGVLMLTLPKVTATRDRVVKLNLADTTSATPEVTDAPVADAKKPEATESAEPASVWD
ncbi:Hsp20/alpha crystallin family protein [Coleofasciculus sp. FACHB-1120]|uniref:Hsp20/alpha crystallin family protein n=1 Tax=Coleofasciculus sp. FACHB-1120 TaxID=2692783 RepID=UPI001681FCB7|nr:Hsp20/alpha crystallin family protein [Coleofasciculus sp. FACHB-1120]MBD2741295.1 Hsp20/alpha crystallin family protein [Coleofasciculus sp. FACHB-1120]